MRVEGTAFSLSDFLLLFGLGTLLLVPGCPAQNFIFRPERDFVSCEVTIPGQLGSYKKDPEAAVGRLSYLLGMEGKEHIATLFPWAKGGKVMSNQACDPITTQEKVHHWTHTQTPGKTSFCHLPQNYADLVMVVSSHDEVRCTQEGCCSRGLCHLQGRSLLARRASESPAACYEKGALDSGSLGFGGLIYKQCEDGDIFCGRLLCSEAKVVPILPDGSVILSLMRKSGIVCWGTDYLHEMVTVQIPDVEKIKGCNPCGEGFLCFNKTCNTVSLFKVDCASDRCVKGGVCKGHRNCRCKLEGDLPFFKRPEYREGSTSVSSTKRKKPPRKSILPMVMFHMRLFLLIISIGLAFLAKMIALLFV